MLRKRLTNLACLAIAPLLALVLSAQADGDSSAVSQEYTVKAQFLTKFSLYVDWPPKTFQTPDSALTVCVIGDSPINDGLAALRGQPIGSHPLAIEHIDAVDEADRCHLLFVAAAKKSKLSSILGPLETKGVLTVSDMSGFAKAGGMIEFVPVDGKVRFEINLAAAQKAGLNIRSQLLALARNVYY